MSEEAYVELDLVSLPGPGMAVRINGVDMTNQVRAITLTAGSGDRTRMIVDFPCSARVVGEDVIVDHRCGLEEGA